MKKNILFLCYPGIGIIEQWLPIIINLKKKGSKVDILFFSSEHLSQFEKKNFVHTLAKKSFDNFYYDDRSNIFKVKSVNKIHKKKYDIFKFFFKNKNFLKLESNFEIFISNYNTILYDTYFDLVDKYNYSNLIKKKHKFSLHHGVALFQQKKKLPPKKNFYRVNNQVYYKKTKNNFSNLTIFNYTKDEISFWKFIYEKVKIKNIRVPIFKNDKRWIQNIINQSKKDYPLNWKNYIFLISRPINEDYFKFEQKKKYFLDIVKVCSIHNKNLVIRFHPKENKKQWKKIYLDILKNYQIKYCFSESHPYKIAYDSLFTICFFSELSISLASLNIPVIEYLNLKNIADPTNSCLRDKKNKKVFDYRYSQLVIGVDDYDSFKEKFEYVMKNRNNVANKTNKLYLKLFDNNYKKVNKVADLIRKTG